MSAKKKQAAGKGGQRGQTPGKGTKRAQTTRRGGTGRGHSTHAPQDRWRIARYLWATVAALLIAALLLEATMVWMLGVGLWMLANAELLGLWMVVVGYVLACIPWAIGLLIATGRFWLAMTHALWIGIAYSVLGVLLLDQVIGFG